MANGASVVIKGHVTAAEDFVVTGRVEGDIHLEHGVLTVAQGAHIVGEVAAPSVVALGDIDGNVTAADRLEVRQTAVIRGNLQAPVLILSDGAQVTGRVDMPAVKRAAPLKFPVAV